MFTGIITDFGRLKIRKGQILTFSAKKDFIKKLKKGTSISINGACLTVMAKPKKGTRQTFSVEIMPETEKKTTLGKLSKDTMVNFELPATFQTFLSGHIVEGHIDGVGKIVNIKRNSNSQLITIKVAPSLSRYIVEKGSIAVDGISLTVIESKKNHFLVGIIPYTLQNTSLKEMEIGDLVNIETDILAKYVYKFFKKI